MLMQPTRSTRTEELLPNTALFTSDEDRGHVRQSRDDHRRKRAEVLRLGPSRHPPHRQPEGQGRPDRQPDTREGGEEQGGAAVPDRRVRHPLRTEEHTYELQSLMRISYYVYSLTHKNKKITLA